MVGLKNSQAIQDTMHRLKVAFCLSEIVLRTLLHFIAVLKYALSPLVLSSTDKETY